MAARSWRSSCNGRGKYGASKGYERPITQTFPFEGADPFSPVVSPLPGVSCGRSLTASVGGKMLSYIARASRIKRSRSRSDFEINPTISPNCVSSGAASFKTLPEQVLWQVTTDEYKPSLAGLLLLPGTPTAAFNEHVHALNDELPIVILY